ncbi:diacylglycerol kinase family protein [Spartinivicinus poritis]|uniref:Diacylglycerol kinase family protein n=1 Tax=Spartinivicinus poritis TaxID=2994640 RepID=A0ABT5UCR4_9GAMM|nr:diacylglycerol kinase family protein [Spartinivicinus sp. A2-2]MDE1464165.1 diacylglycerol kinase family protein [Spartinivicinus sp. A2-2]
MTHALIYTTSGLSLIAVAAIPLPWLMRAFLFWTGLSLLVVGIAYHINRPEVFRKRADGTIPLYIRWLFIPFLWGSTLYNLWAKRTDNVPALQKIENHLFLGCRLSSRDMEVLNRQDIRAILDVTAEFDALDWSAVAEEIDYLNLPVLDQAPPTAKQCIQAIHWIHAHVSKGQNVLVHCAMGRSRSALMVAAYLLSQKSHYSPQQIIEELRSIRRTVRLTKKQAELLQKLYQEGSLQTQNNAWLIVNPVAGGGKWEQHKPYILSHLEPYLKLTIKCTTPEISAARLTQEAIQDMPDIIIAGGGDGTLAEVAGELIGTKIALGIMPLGTANSLSYAIWGNSAKLTPIETACFSLTEGKSQWIDTARCNDKTMLLMAGIGFAEKMIKLADRDKKNNNGQIAYIQGLWQAALEKQHYNVRLTLDDQEPEHIHTTSLVIANAAPPTSILAQGGGAPNITDGLLDITWIDSEDKHIEQLTSLANLAVAGITNSAADMGIQYRQAKTVLLEVDPPIAYMVDGERNEPDSLRIALNHKSLKVMVPIGTECC